MGSVDRESRRPQLGVSFGYFDSDVPSLLARLPMFVEDCDCLITCLDSGMNTAKELQSVLPELPHLGPYAVMAGELALSHSSLFSGFDEIYVFKREAWVTASSALFRNHYTTDAVQFNQGVPGELLAAFVGSGALHYASDGIGLNVMTRDLAVFRCVREQFPELSD